jgi:hypothetical protein
MKGNEKDCICDKRHGKHRKNCDAYRLGQFLGKAAAIDTSPHPFIQEKEPECKCGIPNCKGHLEI